MSEAEVRYFSGFHTPFWQSPTRPWFLFIPAEGAPVAVIPEISGFDANHLDHGYPYMGRPKSSGRWRQPAGFTAPLAQRGVSGVMKGHETGFRMPLGDWEHLMARLTGLKIKDATKIVQAPA